MPKTRPFLGLCACLLVLLSACGNQGNASHTTPTETATSANITAENQAASAAQPEASKATLTGWVVGKLDSKPLAGAAARLAEVYRKGGEGAFVLDESHSPAAEIGQNGFFIFPNIKPGEYVLVITDSLDNSDVILGSDDKPKVWNAEAGKVLNMGEIRSTIQP